MSQNIIEELEQYYTENRISARGFKCQYYKECKGECKTFSKAKEAMVGSEYEKHTVPRILFISLDPGTSSRIHAERTTEYQRENEIVENESDLGPGGKHWKETCLLAHRILKRFKPDLTLLEIQAYFAHTNSAKCCQNKSGGGMADERLFDNCREYIRGEIEVLDPNIIITQGDQAWNAVKHDSVEQDIEPGGKILIRVAEGKGNYEQTRNAYYDNGILHINHREVLWFHFHHTNAFGFFWDQKKICYKHWANVIEEKFEERFGCEV